MPLALWVLSQRGGCSGGRRGQLGSDTKPRPSLENPLSSRFFSKPLHPPASPRSFKKLLPWVIGYCSKANLPTDTGAASNPKAQRSGSARRPHPWHSSHSASFFGALAFQQLSRGGIGEKAHFGGLPQGPSKGSSPKPAITAAENAAMASGGGGLGVPPALTLARNPILPGRGKLGPCFPGRAIIPHSRLKPAAGGARDVCFPSTPARLTLKFIAPRMQQCLAQGVSRYKILPRGNVPRQRKWKTLIEFIKRKPLLPFG